VNIIKNFALFSIINNTNQVFTFLGYYAASNNSYSATFLNILSVKSTKLRCVIFQHIKYVIFTAAAARNKART